MVADPHLGQYRVSIRVCDTGLYHKEISWYWDKDKNAQLHVSHETRLVVASVEQVQDTHIGVSLWLNWALSVRNQHCTVSAEILKEETKPLLDGVISRYFTCNSTTFGGELYNNLHVWNDCGIDCSILLTWTVEIVFVLQWNVTEL